MRFPRERFFILFGLDEGGYSWRGLSILFGVFFGAIALASVLAVPFYQLIGWWDGVSPNAFTEVVMRKGLDKTFDRIRWIPVLLALPWMLKACGLLSWRNLGFRFGRKAVMDVAGWWAVGVAMLMLAAVVQAHFAGLYVSVNFSWGMIVKKALVAVLSGVILGVVEEAVLRGMVQRMFYTAMRPMGAVLASALFFACVHFKDIPHEAWQEGASVGWMDGFVIALWTVLSIFKTFDPVEFLNLFLVGAGLGLLFLRTRSLWPCVGLHAGWVWVLTVYKKAFDVRPEGSNALLGTDQLLNGYLASLILGGLCLYLYFGWRDGQRHEKA